MNDAKVVEGRRVAQPNGDAEHAGSVTAEGRRRRDGRRGHGRVGTARVPAPVPAPNRIVGTNRESGLSIYAGSAWRLGSEWAVQDSNHDSVVGVSRPPESQEPFAFRRLVWLVVIGGRVTRSAVTLESPICSPNPQRGGMPVGNRYPNDLLGRYKDAPWQRLSAVGLGYRGSCTQGRLVLRCASVEPTVRWIATLHRF